MGAVNWQVIAVKMQRDNTFYAAGNLRCKHMRVCIYVHARASVRMSIIKQAVFFMVKALDDYHTKLMRSGAQDNIDNHNQKKKKSFGGWLLCETCAAPHRPSHPQIFF
eukprot:1159271-Pelagomonas_calceolata.AAC.1